MWEQNQANCRFKKVQYLQEKAFCRKLARNHRLTVYLKKVRFVRSQTLSNLNMLSKNGAQKMNPNF